MPILKSTSPELEKEKLPEYVEKIGEVASQGAFDEFAQGSQPPKSEGLPELDPNKDYDAPKINAPTVTEHLDNKGDQ